jgi:miniconductance mechanosensitive channel
MRSIRFVDAELKQRLQKIQLLREYIAMRQAEIDADNQRRSVDLESPVNGRRMTNVGLFRKYIETYLQNHPQINREMTCMVRQLAPMEYGLPLEIYAFSKIKAWVEYEAIIADIFDHLLAIVGQFDLEVFERPAGTDLNRT